MLTALSLSGCGDSLNPPTPAAAPLTCSQLVGKTVPAGSIGLPTTGATVTAAATMPASGTGAQAVGEYCLVSGAISPVDTSAPQIKFQIAMPTTWNHKIMMFGGGGYDGTIPAPTGNVPAGPTTQLTPLGRGYATFASDSGHQANALGSEDASFGVNDEAINNFDGTR